MIDVDIDKIREIWDNKDYYFSNKFNERINKNIFRTIHLLPQLTDGLLIKYYNKKTRELTTGIIVKIHECRWNLRKVERLKYDVCYLCPGQLQIDNYDRDCMCNSPFTRIKEIISFIGEEDFTL